MRTQRNQEIEATTKIQAVYRGKKGRAELAEGAGQEKLDAAEKAEAIQEEDEAVDEGGVPLENAATKIQARYRQKAAAQEVEQMRTQRNQEIEATTKIQAVYRGKKGRAELAEGAGQEKIDAAEKAETIQEEDEAVDEGGVPLENAATKIQARYRQKAAAQEVEQMRTQRNQEIEATTKIQAVYRGKKGRAELAEGAGQEKIDAAEKAETIQEEDEAVDEGGVPLENAATKIQARYRQKAAAQEVEQMRTQRNQEIEATTKIQAVYRGKKGRAELAEGAGQEKIDAAEKAETIQEEDEAVDEGGVPLENAATKIQARYRQKAAAQEVEQMRTQRNQEIEATTKIQAVYRGKKGRAELAEGAGQEKIDAAEKAETIQEEDEAVDEGGVPLENAATKIQARYRQKAAAQEVEQMRTQRNQEIEATTKIQAVYRGKKGRAELAEGAGQEKTRCR
ncbi:unnamed protein product [Polarella glacialis]|uniref:Uncharacterized protein n=1 Tax=Polarella glacialis TaxID=89957 RepID=A0A813GKT0_POLGL|nr:unnamed protein product [Polarella glacialis]